MAARALLTAVGVVTAALTLAVPAQADPVPIIPPPGVPSPAAPTPNAPADASFLNALNDAGIGYNDPAVAAHLGEQVCPMLVEPGKNFATVASQVRDGGISPEMASFFTGIAISMYCPQMMSSIGDGRILSSLDTLDGLGGLAGLAPLIG